MAFATFLVWRLRIGACGVGACAFWRLWQLPVREWRREVATYVLSLFRCCFFFRKTRLTRSKIKAARSMDSALGGEAAADDDALRLSSPIAPSPSAGRHGTGRDGRQSFALRSFNATAAAAGPSSRAHSASASRLPQKQRINNGLHPQSQRIRVLLPLEPFLAVSRRTANETLVAKPHRAVIGIDFAH